MIEFRLASLTQLPRRDIFLAHRVLDVEIGFYMPLSTRLSQIKVELGNTDACWSAVIAQLGTGRLLRQDR